MKRSSFIIWLYALALGIPAVLFPLHLLLQPRRHVRDSEGENQSPEPRAKAGNQAPVNRIKYCRKSGNTMRKFCGAVTITLLLSAIALAGPSPSSQSNQPFPGTLRNARYVYVAAYDGDEFNIHLLPEDRDAIVAVQDAIRKWGKLTLVYRPDEADIVLLVESRPSEDILAVYDARQLPSGTYL